MAPVGEAATTWAQAMEHFVAWKKLRGKSVVEKNIQQLPKDGFWEP